MKKFVIPLEDFNFDELNEYKIRFVKGGIAMAVSNEEDELITHLESCGGKKRTAFNERELELAKHLVSKGVLKRSKEDDGILYQFNDLQDLWRD